MRTAPSPAEILRDIPLPPKVRASLERAVLHESMDGLWTVGRLLAIPGFGLRTLHDAVATAVAMRHAAMHPEGTPSVLEDELAPLLVARPRLWPRPPTPLLERAIGVIGALAPASEAHILAELRQQALTRGEVTLAQIERASRFVEAPIPYAILRRGDLCLVVPGPDLSTTQRFYGLAVRSVVSWGLANLIHLAEQAGAARLDFLRTVVASRPSFRWLDKQGAWFWFESEDSRLVRAMERTLEAGSMALDQLAQALFDRRPREFVPPLQVLEELCRQVPSLTFDAAGRVALRASGLPMLGAGPSSAQA
ncbi:MAG: hypothetical protein SF187_15175 [Deltaproteobacteria bacterium]|nr:hypothetical protein [Deltaproteobacteria bacterium]